MGRNLSSKLFAAALALGLVVASVFALLRRSPSRELAAASATPPHFYSDVFPVEPRFYGELELLRNKQRLTLENEVLIRRLVGLAAPRLEMPTAVLWCLLFQESRLNHLEGVSTANGKVGAVGIGQFSPFSFAEINGDLNRFTDLNYSMMIGLLGRDVRPIEARRKPIHHPSSYFSIPTAVTASAAYLNNRYLQLARNLERRGIAYDRDVLWLHATMAYNKGTRSVLSFWGETYRRNGGDDAVQRIVTDARAFREATSRHQPLFRALRRIWPDATAQDYAVEWRIHQQNMHDCAVARFGEVHGRL